MSVENEMLTYETITDRLCSQFKLERSLFKNLKQKVAEHSDYEFEGRIIFPLKELQETNCRSIQYVYLQKLREIEITLIFDYRHLDKLLKAFSDLDEFEFLSKLDKNATAGYNYPFIDCNLSISVVGADRVVLIIFKNDI